MLLSNRESGCPLDGNVRVWTGAAGNNDLHDERNWEVRHFRGILPPRATAPPVEAAHNQFVSFTYNCEDDLMGLAWIRRSSIVGFRPWSGRVVEQFGNTYLVLSGGIGMVVSEPMWRVVEILNGDQ